MKKEENSIFVRRIKAVKLYPFYVNVIITRFFIKLFIKMKGCKVGRRGKYFGLPIITMANSSQISIGDDCVLCSISKYTALGVKHPVILRTLYQNSSISIGKNTGISGGVICAATSVSIGDNCLIGADVTITDTDFHPLLSLERPNNYNRKDIKESPVVIGKNVFLGTSVIILKGVKIGDNTIIGAGSVVVRSIPSNCIAAGNPAQIIKKINLKDFIC